MIVADDKSSEFQLFSLSLSRSLSLYFYVYENEGNITMQCRSATTNLDRALVDCTYL